MDDLLARAAILGDDAQLDLCTAADRPMPDGDGSTAGMGRAERRYRHGDITRHITTVHGPKGRMPVLRMLQTNACAKDCFYCPFRAGRSIRREAFTSDELARLVDGLQRAKAIDGLFLSSGVIGHDDDTMAQIVATGEILRRRYRFRGFLHLKLMPGASEAAIAAALAVADRVSINLEAPSPLRLARLTSTKDLGRDLLAPLRKVRDLLARSGKAVSRTTQFVVGPAGESDAEILTQTDRLYRQLGLARVYYSAFRPIPDTPLDGRPAEDPRRQRRLYEADFLLRDYGFGMEELPLVDGRLSLGIDPKLAWARANRGAFPIEVARADRVALMRIPGIGPAAAKAIVAARRKARLRGPDALRRLGVPDRALDWVTVNGQYPPRQLGLPLGDGPDGQGGGAAPGEEPPQS